MGRRVRLAPKLTAIGTVEEKGIGLLSHCEIGAAGFAIISFFGAIFAGFSLVASAGIAIGVAVVLVLICPKPLR